MKFPSRKLVIAAFGILLAAGCIFWLYQPLPQFDPARVEPKLLSLQKPYRSIYTAFYGDGGSIGIEIVDRDGKREQFAIPAHMSFSETNKNGKVFVGRLYDRWPGAIEVADSEQTKRMLLHVLASMPHRKVGDDFCLAVLSHRRYDALRCFIHSWIDNHFS